jgi:hypothetical protein
MDPAAAERLITKLRTFATEILDDDERALLATLLAPGIARAYADADEVRGFGIDEWSGAPLTEALVEAVRSGGLRVVGLEDQPS